MFSRRSPAFLIVRFNYSIGRSLPGFCCGSFTSIRHLPAFQVNSWCEKPFFFLLETVLSCIQQTAQTQQRSKCERLCEPHLLSTPLTSTTDAD